jgi:redox-sensitive bicupin YhaK (pirin superfamily)
MLVRTVSSAGCKSFGANARRATGSWLLRTLGYTSYDSIPRAKRTEYRFEPGHGGYIYVIEGDLDINLERIGPHDAARVVGDGRLHIQASNPSELLIVDVAI